MSGTSDLPVGWTKTRLADVVRMGSGGTPRAKDPALYDGGIPWAVIGDLTDGPVATTGRTISALGLEQSSAKMVPPGTVLLAMYGSIGKLGLAVTEMATNQAIAFLSAERGIEPKYLFWYLLSQRHSLQAAGKGATQQNISQTVLRDWPIVVPPTAEQGRIVAALEEKLSALDRGINDLQPLDRQLERLEESVIHAAVLGRLIPGAAGAVPATSHLAAALGSVPAPDTPDLPALPERWAWTTLGALCEVTGGVTKDAKKQGDPRYIEVPYLRVANVQKGRLDLADVARIRVPEAKAEALRLLPGDVLFNEGGDRDKLGRGWVWEGQIPDCIHQNHVFRGRIRDGVLNPYLLSWHGNTFGRRWFEAAGKQTTNLASLSMTNLKRLPVPVPPLEDQPTIVAEVQRRLSIIGAARDDIAAVHRKAQLLRSSLLHTAFSGHLAHQDPADEPAELLLKRIAEDRVTAQPTARRRTRTVTPAPEVNTELVEESA